MVAEREAVGPVVGRWGEEVGAEEEVVRRVEGEEVEEGMAGLEEVEVEGAEVEGGGGWWEEGSEVEVGLGGGGGDGRWREEVGGGTEAAAAAAAAGEGMVAAGVGEAVEVDFPDVRVRAAASACDVNAPERPGRRASKEAVSETAPPRQL
ncbi:hypothetical protein CYMTET_34069 [Cymbomonas tetramitiformis]|uniref:Uncharacterized protein n=1 Tax=Cymbomonas tetramitiformis TaxID=36881 RepID=A0AAE0KQB9_9CHLO|nr:hypothetical protein CYMTET_34069 [Cymbomonas tetramitiformis]